MIAVAATEVDAGARVVMLNPIFDEIEQLEMLASDVAPRL